jgi:hypothetical protein
MRARSRSVANICCLSATPAADGEPFLRGLSLRRLTLLLRPNILGGRCRSAGRSTMRRSVNPIRTNSLYVEVTSAAVHDASPPTARGRMAERRGRERGTES